MPAKFPINAVNRKAIREQLLLDSTGSGVERALVRAAESAAGPGQEVFVSRSYTKAGRLSVWIVDRGSTPSRDKTKQLREALARVRI